MEYVRLDNAATLKLYLDQLNQLHAKLMKLKEEIDRLRADRRKKLKEVEERIVKFEEAFVNLAKRLPKEKLPRKVTKPKPVEKVEKIEKEIKNIEELRAEFERILQELGAL